MQRQFATLTEMEVAATGGAPATFESRDGVVLSVRSDTRGFRYFVCGQQVAERTAVANFDHIRRRA